MPAVINSYLKYRKEMLINHPKSRWIIGEFYGRIKRTYSTVELMNMAGRGLPLTINDLMEFDKGILNGQEIQD